MHPVRWLWLAIAASGASAVPVIDIADTRIDVRAAAAPIPPSQDPFYQPPSGYENSAPGTILKSRPVPVPVAFYSYDPVNVKGAYQLLYRTTDSHGNPEAAVITVIQPYNADAGKLVSYQTAEDAPFVDCAPSYTFQFGSQDFGNGQKIELLLILAALNKGYYVNTPDYEGPKAAFAAGIQAGHATLDSIRAALSSTKLTGLSSKARTTLWGYSGGSLASGWAVQLQPTYAPELQLAGAALGGTVPNITSVLFTINNGPFVGLAPEGILGLANEYPKLDAYIKSALIPGPKYDAFMRARSQCLIQNALSFAFQDVFSYFTAGRAVINNPIPQSVLAENTLGTTAPSVPIYIYKSINDELTPVGDTDELVAGWCQKGARVQYLRDELSEHISLAATGAPGALDWIEDRLAGEGVSGGCSRLDVASTLGVPRALATLGEAIVGDLAVLVGEPVGPGSVI